MKKLFTEYWQEFDLRYIKNMYGAELPLLYFVIYWSWSLVFGNAAGTDATSVTEAGFAVCGQQLSNYGYYAFAARLYSD